MPIWLGVDVREDSEIPVVVHVPDDEPGSLEQIVGAANTEPSPFLPEWVLQSVAGIRGRRRISEISIR